MTRNYFSGKGRVARRQHSMYSHCHIPCHLDNISEHPCNPVRLSPRIPSLYIVFFWLALAVSQRVELQWCIFFKVYVSIAAGACNILTRLIKNGDAMSISIKFYMSYVIVFMVLNLWTGINQMGMILLCRKCLCIHTGIFFVYIPALMMNACISFN